MAMFSPLVGETFTLRVDDSRSLDVELAQCSDLSRDSPASRSDDGRRSPFSLVFRGPANVVLPQRIYRLQHPSVGSFEPFLVTIGPDERGMRYEAIFS